MKQRYDSYKPSGIDWIGDIPSHWKTCTLKQSSNSIRNGYVGPTKDILVDDGIPYFQSLHVKDGKLLFDRGEYYVAPKWADKHPKIYKDNIVIVQTGDIGQVAIVPSEYDGCNCHALIIVVSDKQKIRPLYLLYYLRSSIGKELMLLTKTGATLPHLNSGSISNTQIILPPLAEQEAIAAWLDEKCGEIDAAIAKVDREIELIDELKQSEISRVVTRGLNPDAPLRPSGIDWIGNIPEHWTKSRIKNHISRSAAGVWGDDEKGNKNDIICFRIADFNYGERCLSFDKITIRNIDPKQLEGRYLSKGDLLIEKSGGGETTPVGRVVYCNFDGKATYTNFIHSITLSDNVDSRFFLHYFNMLYSNKINLLYFNQTTGLQNLQIGEYLGQPIYLPPLSEQQAITDYLDNKCAEIDGLKAKLTKKRETLKELRQSIISEVVTGKRKII